MGSRSLRLRDREMTYRIDGTTTNYFCAQHNKPLWNAKRCRAHFEKFEHYKSAGKWHQWKRGDFPKKGANAGEKNGSHKLTVAQVRCIRRLYEGNHYSTYWLARKFKVTQGNIWFIVSGKTWKSLSSPSGRRRSTA